jgi:hypothetical protein
MVKLSAKLYDKDKYYDFFYAMKTRVNTVHRSVSSLSSQIIIKNKILQFKDKIETK